MVVICNQVYNIGGNTMSLKLLYLGPKRKIRCHNGYFINGYVFYIEDYREGGNTYNSGVCVNESIFNEFEVDYYGKLEKYHSITISYGIKYNFFLFKCYWYDTYREIRIDLHHGLVEINKRGRLSNINDVFVFSKQYQQVHYTYTQYLERIVIELIDCLL